MAGPWGLQLGTLHSSWLAPISADNLRNKKNKGRTIFKQLFMIISKIFALLIWPFVSISSVTSNIRDEKEK